MFKKSCFLITMVSMLFVGNSGVAKKTNLQEEKSSLKVKPKRLGKPKRTSPPSKKIQQEPLVNSETKEETSIKLNGRPIEWGPDTQIARVKGGFNVVNTGKAPTFIPEADKLKVDYSHSYSSQGPGQKLHIGDSSFSTIFKYEVGLQELPTLLEKRIEGLTKPKEHPVKPEAPVKTLKRKTLGTPVVKRQPTKHKPLSKGLHKKTIRKTHNKKASNIKQPLQKSARKASIKKPSRQKRSLRKPT